MLISLKGNFAFLAMTKTGSTAIEAALAPYCDIHFGGHPKVKHMTARRFERFMRPYLEVSGHGQVETVCVMRAPVDWLASWWRYRQRPELAGAPQSTAAMSFDAFVCGYLDGAAQIKAIGRPSRFVAGRDGTPVVTHLFAYERLGEAVAFMEGRLGVALKLARVNASPVAQAELSAATMARLTREMAADLDLYEKILRR